MSDQLAEMDNVHEIKPAYTGDPKHQNSKYYKDNNKKAADNEKTVKTKEPVEVLLSTTAKQYLDKLEHQQMDENSKDFLKSETLNKE